MSQQILLSVVIPTYNRYKYLKGSIEAFETIKSDEIEFVIQDNTENNKEIVEFLKEVNDPRIKYFHYRAHISQTENSDMAVENSCGEYVAFIGDDDTICGSIIEAAKFCKENGIDTCLSELPGFNWPDMEFVGGKKQANLYLAKRVTGRVTRIDTTEQVDFALRYADGIPEQMPRVYHGITSRKVLDVIKEKTGTFFPGPSPDMASSLAISLSTNKAIFISDYIMISGYGYKSARGEGNRQQHYGKISEKPWLPKDTEKKWDPEIPKIFSGETIIAESLSRCLREMERNDLLKKYSYGILYAVFFVRHSSARKYMLSFLLRKPLRFGKFVLGVIKRKKYIMLYQKTHSDNNYKEFEGVASLLEAQKIVNKERSQITEYYF